MKKTRFELSSKEQLIMNLFWDTNEALTSIDILDKLSAFALNPTYVHRTLSTLLEKEFIEECGSVRYNKQYARKFKPSVTREEFAVGLLTEKNIHFNSLNGIAVAFLKQSTNMNSHRKKEVINELKQMINELEQET